MSPINELDDFAIEIVSMFLQIWKVQLYAVVHCRVHFVS